MYLFDDGYSMRPDTPEQRKVYGYVRKLATLPSHEAISTFYRLLWDGNAYPDDSVQTALKEVVKAPDFEQHKLKIINRCYYTLANPWHLDGTKDYALGKLILWLEDIPAGRGQNPLTRKLRDTLRLYQSSAHYEILKKHLFLLESDGGSAAKLQQRAYFGDLFADYFYIYEAGTQTLDIENDAEKLSVGVLQKRNEKLLQFQQDLNRFYVRRDRSSSAIGDNPTRLSDEELYVAINLYRPKRQNSFKKQSDTFRTKELQIRTTHEFKRAIHDHVMQPLYQLSSKHERWFRQEFQTTLDSLPSDVPLTRVVKVNMFRRLLSALLRHDASKPGGDQLFYLITGAGPDVVTSILLNVVLACKMARFELEKRFAYLHHTFSSAKNDVVQWLITAFEHMNIALALNAKYLEYFQLRAWEDAKIPDSV